MTCRSCGVEIADKAIVCFRCGTPTAVPAVRREAPPGQGRGRMVRVVLAVVVVLAALLLLLWLRQ